LTSSWDGFRRLSDELLRAAINNRESDVLVCFVDGSF
jgi:hypothetical protein